MTGSLEIITGPMFSGKSTELIRRAKRFELAQRSVQVFKPTCDTRYELSAVASHSGLKLPAQPIRDLIELIHAIKHSTNVVCMDEAQFISPTLAGVARTLVDEGKHVIVAGLDRDSFGNAFLDVNLYAHADKVTKLTAVCVHCGDDATHTFRKSADQSRQLVGGVADYEARCRRCYDVQ